MGAEESTPQQKQPLIPQQPTPANAQNLANGPVDPPANEEQETKKQAPPNEPQPEPSQNGTKDPPPTQEKQPAPIKEPPVTSTPSTKEPPSEAKKETKAPKQEEKTEAAPPNPYVDDNLVEAQKEYSPQKNKTFEKKHAVDATQDIKPKPKAETQPAPVTKSTSSPQKTEVKPTPKPQPKSPPETTEATKPKPIAKITKQTVPKSSKTVAQKSTYEPEKASMDVKEQIEQYFHTSYPIHITEDVFNTKTDLIRLRRYFHANPELSWEEIETAKNISNYCESLGLATKKGVGKTGVVAVLHGAFSDGLCIALRSDMDALPIHEENNHIAYKSRVSGVSHACGHDCHMSILLTVARILSQPKYVKRLHGCVKFIFQPAEEGGAGAKCMVNEGVLNEDNVVLNCPEVDQVYGLHVWSYCKLGKIVLKSGALMAGSSMFTLKVKGVGGHGAEPKGTSDSVLALTQLSIQLHSIVSRNISPIECGVVTIGTMHVGDAGNVIAECGKITGTVRYLDNDVFGIIKKRMKEICEGIERSYGVQVDLIWGKDPYPPVINHTQNVDNVRRAVNKVFPITENVLIDQTTMAAEDFSFYLNEKPGCFFFVGCGVDENEGDENKDNLQCNAPQKVLRHIEDGDEKKAKIYAHHTPTFRVDERCLVVGVQIMINLVMDLLTNPKVVEEEPEEEHEQGQQQEDVEEDVKESEEVIEDKMIGDNQ